MAGNVKELKVNNLSHRVALFAINLLLLSIFPEDVSTIKLLLATEIYYLCCV